MDVALGQQLPLVRTQPPQPLVVAVHRQIALELAPQQRHLPAEHAPDPQLGLGVRAPRQLRRHRRGPEPIAVAGHVQAHALKGSAANIGGDGLADLLAGIEQRARDGHLPDAAALDRVRTESTEVAAVCEALAAELSPAGTAQADSWWRR
ncbi:Hpt domain-containing protein [Dactylosporangium sp. NPDC050588]|uniref:Hpt domain-containing protein n=1 Tax=Dactylosporangium sp. NPDC050588 TaxID=3157211 RepID=UPI0033FEC782